MWTCDPFPDSLSNLTVDRKYYSCLGICLVFNSVFSAKKKFTDRKAGQLQYGIHNHSRQVIFRHLYLWSWRRNHLGSVKWHGIRFGGASVARGHSLLDFEVAECHPSRLLKPVALLNVSRCPSHFTCGTRGQTWVKRQVSTTGCPVERKGSWLVGRALSSKCPFSAVTALIQFNLFPEADFWVCLEPDLELQQANQFPRES